MKTQIRLIAGLSYIDARLDELKDEFGDLPEQIEEKQLELDKATKKLAESKKILEEIKDFVAQAKVTLVKLKDKEEELSKKQFKVKNNKEFDAITSEIQHLKDEHENLSKSLRSEGIKQENLLKTIEEQERKLTEIQEEFDELNTEFEDLKKEQGNEVDVLESKRQNIEGQLVGDYLKEYKRIRKFHSDAAVQVVKGSCKGYRVPPQVLVELRNNEDKIFIDENSGRILIPEEIHLDEDIINELVA